MGKETKFASEKNKGYSSKKGNKRRSNFKVENEESFNTPTKGRFNDVSWYKKVPGTELAARIPFTRPIGRPYDADTLGIRINSSDVLASPGICVMHYVPAVGFTEEGVQSPIDRAAHKIWMEFRTKNTGAITYDAPDIMLNLIAGVNIHAFYYDLTRVYGLIHKAMVTENEYLARDLVYALGYDYDNLKSNIAEFGVWLNTIQAYINDNIHIPNTFTLYNRYVFMNAGVYKDEDLDRYQMYAFKADGYYIFNERVPNEPGFVELKKMPNKAGLSSLRDYFDVMWSRYALSESMADIQSGYFKYFGTAFHTLPTVDLNYVVEPIYSFDMMRQIQNAKFVGAIDWTRTNAIKQDATSGFLSADVGIKMVGVMSDVIPDAQIMNLFINNPTSDDVIEATRCMSTIFNMAVTGDGTTRTIAATVGTCGSEVFTTMDFVIRTRDSQTGEIYTMRYADITTYGVGFHYGRIEEEPTSLFTGQGSIGQILDSFSYHPTLCFSTQDDTSGDAVNAMFIDLANVMILPNDQLERINELCVMSQFTIF